MLDSSSEPPASSDDRDRLNGWKEIAAFLGKGVRTAQRWEREYGMPVHRLGRDGGEIIWASRHELSAWMVKNESRTRHDREPAARTTPSPPAPLPAPAQPDRAQRPQWPQGFVAAAAVVLLVIAGAAVWPLVKPLFVKGRPASIEAEGRVLWALDRTGRRLWSHSFEFPITVDKEQSGPRAFGAHWLIDDTNGDGKTEVVFLSMDLVNRSPSMALTVFNEDGSVRFTWQPGKRQVRFGDTQYFSPWMPHLVFAGRSSASFFASFIHNNQYPTLLVEFAVRDGRVLGEYWSNGYVETVKRAMWNGREAIFVGAANNETKGASLAIFADGRLAGSAPAENWKYRCVGCPEGGPTEFIVFPRHDVSLGDTVATLQEIRVEDNGTLRIMTGEGDRHPNGALEATTWYALGPSRSVEEADLTEGFAVVHDRMHRAGELDHRQDARDRAASLPVLRWTGERYEELPNNTGIAKPSRSTPKK